MSREENPDFYTQKGYQLRNHTELTGAMEDYLEMICRLSRETGFVRVHQLAETLHVKPSSVTKMAKQLQQQGLIEYQPYGYIRLTGEGAAEGEYLLYRHNVLLRFLRLVNGGDNLEEAEQMEHFFSKKTVRNLERILDEYERQGTHLKS